MKTSFLFAVTLTVTLFIGTVTAGTDEFAVPDPDKPVYAYKIEANNLGSVDESVSPSKTLEECKLKLFAQGLQKVDTCRGPAIVKVTFPNKVKNTEKKAEKNKK